MKDEISKLLHNVDKKTDNVGTRLDIVEKNYVSKLEFTPVKLIVYGLVSVIMLSFMSAILMLIVKKGA